MNRNDVFVQGLLDNNNIRVNINVYIYIAYIFFAFFLLDRIPNTVHLIN